MRMNNTLYVYKFLWNEYQNLEEDFKGYKKEGWVIENPKSIYFKRKNGKASRFDYNEYMVVLENVIMFVNRYYFLHGYFNDECKSKMVDFMVAHDMINGMEENKGYIDKFFYNTIILNEEKYELSPDNCKE